MVIRKKRVANNLEIAEEMRKKYLTKELIYDNI